MSNEKLNEFILFLVDIKSSLRNISEYKMDIETIEDTVIISFPKEHQDSWENLKSVFGKDCRFSQDGAKFRIWREF